MNLQRLAGHALSHLEATALLLMLSLFASPLAVDFSGNEVRKLAGRFDFGRHLG